MNYKEAVDLANKNFSENYLGKDEEGYCKYRLPLHGYAVHIVHEEGTNLFFESANAERVENYYFVYTEHHGIFIYDVDEINICKYKRIFDI